VINAEKLKQFFEQIRGKGNPTAQDIRNAAAATGNVAEILPEILAYAAGMGIDAASELAGFTNAWEKARQEKTVQETAASLAEQSGELASEADPEKRRELIKGIRRTYETLNKTATIEPKTITSKALMQKTFPPRQWIVVNLICTGLSILSGVSKIGKSWLLFALAEAASEGGKFLDRYAVNKTSVLHLSLEDTEESIKERRETLARKQEGGFSGNDNLIIATEWESGISGLETYLRAHNEIKFVIIDTLVQFMPDIEDMNNYSPTVKALTRIKRMADRLSIAILVVHHAKKGSGKEAKQGDWMDQSLGSQGIVASADTIILLERDINNKTKERLNTGKFYATGRSIKDIFYKVNFSPSFGMWSITDEEKKGAGDDPQPRNNPGQSEPDRKPWTPGG